MVGEFFCLCSIDIPTSCRNMGSVTVLFGRQYEHLGFTKPDRVAGVKD